MERVGEVYAVFSVLAFAFGGVAVAKARRSGPGDGGALLSVVLTALLSCLLWLAGGGRVAPALADRGGWVGMGWFVLSGLLATAAGRSLYFLSVHDLGAVRAAAVKRAIPFFSVIFGVVLLGEVLSTARVGGVALIGVSIGALALTDLLGPGRPDRGREGDGVNPLGYVWGIVSGLSYATSYVARKLGLVLLPDGAFGTFVGAAAALAYYVLAGTLSGRSRAASVAALTARNHWALVAALGFSLGQIANFYAIQYAAVSTVGAIQSLEVFASMVIATLVLRTERAPSAATVAAACVATAGVLLVILG